MGADEQPSPTRKRDREEDAEELSDGAAAEKRPRPEGASLLGMATYEDEEEDEAARGNGNDVRRAPERRPRQVELRRDCPYLDTVNRQAGEVDPAAGGDDLEPLFDYKRVQPRMTFCFDDSDLEAADIFKHCNKRPKVQATTEDESKVEEGVAAAPKVVVLDEEDWLQPPPPKAALRAPAEEDSTFRELRLKKQEWAQFAESAQDMLQKLEEVINKDVGPKEPPGQIILDEESEPQVEKAREKIIISFQDKDGQKQMRVYKDEKFDKLLKAYAKKAKLNPSELSFVFDGEKINPSSTPQDLDLEDEDMIEVCRKRS